MTERKRLLLSSIVIMTGACFCVAVTAFVILYHVAFEEERERLVETAQSQARLIEAIVRFHRTHGDASHIESIVPTTVTQIADAHARYEGFGETGEFTLARLKGDAIEFILKHRHEDAFGSREHHAPVPMSGRYAEPMRRALRGLSGTVVGLDYRGETVLAAYEPVALVNFGIVAKIDLAEIRAPFIKAGCVTAGAALLLIGAGVMLFVRICGPLIRRLEHSEAYAHAIWESAAEGIITIDTGGIVQSFNAAAERIFGYASDDVVGRDVTVLMPSPHAEAHDGYIAAYLETGEARAVGHRREVEGKRKDGSTFPMELAVSEVRVAQKHFFTGIVHDITERVLAQENQIQRLLAENERNHLRDAVQALEQVLGVVSHELRAPLAGMRATTEFLLNEHAEEPGETGTFLNAMHDEIIRMAGTVNDLLEVSRLNNGQAQWNWAEVPVYETCATALDTVRPLVDQTQITLRCDVDPPDMMMRGDADAIRRLILNLVTNAAKFTSEGSISVSARDITEQNQRYIMLSVSDTGGGIPPEIAKQLGKAFVLGSGMIGDSYVQGAGLGLAICQGIVAAHGGRISVDTTLGKGTTVNILLQADLRQPTAVEDTATIACEVEP